MAMTGRDEPPSPEFDAFRNLASKLVKVPKKELDEARDRDKADRQV